MNYSSPLLRSADVTGSPAERSPTRTYVSTFERRRRSVAAQRLPMEPRLSILFAVVNAAPLLPDWGLVPANPNVGAFPRVGTS